MSEHAPLIVRARPSQHVRDIGGLCFILNQRDAWSFLASKRAGDLPVASMPVPRHRTRIAGNCSVLVPDALPRRFNK